MVEYLGPEWLERFCESLEIDVFNRVTEIHLAYLSRESCGLDQSTLADLKMLRSIEEIGWSMSD